MAYAHFGISVDSSDGNKEAVFIQSVGGSVLLGLHVKNDDVDEANRSVILDRAQCRLLGQVLMNFAEELPR